MNAPRLRLRNLGRDEHPAGNGAAPRVRLREQPQLTPEAAPPKESAARRLLQPLPLVGLALVLVALIGYWAIYNASTKRTSILVTTRALPAGTVITASDLRTGELAGDSPCSPRWCPGASFHRPSGGGSPSGAGRGPAASRGARSPAGANVRHDARDPGVRRQRREPATG